MSFEAFEPKKKRSIGFTQTNDKRISNAIKTTAEKVASKSAFNSFLSDLGSGGLNLTVKKKYVPLAKQRRRRDVVQKFNKNHFDQYALLKHVSVEANFNLHSLVDNEHGNSPLAISQWVYPESSIKHYAHQSDLSRNVNPSINKDEYWSLQEIKSNLTPTERHVSFSKGLFLKWQQALFSALQMLIDRQIGSFYLMGESLAIDKAADAHHGLFVSAVFRHRTLSKKDSTLHVVEEISCVLIGASKYIKRRLVELGARPSVIADTQERNPTKSGITSTQGLADRFKGGENLYISGKLCVKLTAQCLDEEVLQSILKADNISRLPVISADKPFLNAVPRSPLRVADSCQFRFDESQLEMTTAEGIATGSGNNSSSSSSSSNNSEIKEEGMHRVSLQGGGMTYSSLRGLIPVLIELSRAGHALTNTHTSSSTALEEVSGFQLSEREDRDAAYRYLQKQSETLSIVASTAIATTTAAASSGSSAVTSKPSLTNPMALQVVRANEATSSSSGGGGGGRMTHNNTRSKGEPYFKLRFALNSSRVVYFDYFPTKIENKDCSVEAITRTNTTSSNGSQSQILVENVPPTHHQLVSAGDTLEELIWERDLENYTSSDEDEEEEEEKEGSEMDIEGSDKNKQKFTGRNRTQYDEELVRVSYHPLLPLRQLVPVTAADLTGPSKTSRLINEGGEVLEAFNVDKSGKFVDSKVM